MEPPRPITPAISEWRRQCFTLSPEVLHQHQVVHRGADPGIENRAAIAGSGQAGPNLAEVTRHDGGEAEELQPVLARSVADIVDAFLKYDEAPRNNSPCGNKRQKRPRAVIFLQEAPWKRIDPWKSLVY